MPSIDGHVWPEDTGTSTAQGNEDWSSAGYIGGTLARDNASDYVERGMSFSVDYTNNVLDVAAGLAFLLDTSGSVDVQAPDDDATTFSDTWDQYVTYAVETKQAAGIPLTDNAVNRVWLNPQLDSNDDLYITVDTESDPGVPPTPRLKLGEVDTGNDTATEENRVPDVAVGDMDVQGAFDFDLANASSGDATDGQVPTADGTGGVAWEDQSGGGSDPTTAEEVNNLSINGWEVIDVGNEGFPGDGSGGDLAEFIATNTSAGGKYVFVLPNGTYNWERPVKFTGGSGTHDEAQPEKLAIIGKPDATLYVDIPTDVERLCFRFGDSTNGMPDIRLKDLHFDVGDQSDQRDAGMFRAYIGGFAHFKNLTLSPRKRLQSDGTTNGDRFCIKCDCINEDATAILEKVKLRNGDVFQGAEHSVGHAIPFSAEPTHAGTNIWKNCYVEGFIDNGFYVRDGPGTNHLKNCKAKDNAAGQFRLGSNDKAENITAIVTDACEYNSTPLWIQEYRDVSDQSNYEPGSEDDTPCIVSGFQLHALGDMTNDVIRISTNPPETRLEGGYVRCQADDYVLDCTHNTGKVSLTDVTIDDEATGNTRLAAMHGAGDNIVMENITYRADPPDGENGRSIFWADGCDRWTVKDSDLQSTYFPLVEAESGSEFTMVDTKCENSWGSDPSLVRLRSTPMEYLSLRYNDVRDYTGGLNANTDDINAYHIVGNRGISDDES